VLLLEIENQTPPYALIYNDHLPIFFHSLALACTLISFGRRNSTQNGDRNITAIATFGATREYAFVRTTRGHGGGSPEPAPSSPVRLYLPQHNNSGVSFCRDVNLKWMRGHNDVLEEDRNREGMGTISFILYGTSSAVAGGNRWSPARLNAGHNSKPDKKNDRSRTTALDSTSEDAQSEALPGRGESGSWSGCEEQLITDVCIGDSNEAVASVAVVQTPLATLITQPEAATTVSNNPGSRADSSLAGGSEVISQESTKTAGAGEKSGICSIIDTQTAAPSRASNSMSETMTSVPSHVSRSTRHNQLVPPTCIGIVKELNCNDVLCSRGSASAPIHENPGNIKLSEMVEEYGKVIAENAQSLPLEYFATIIVKRIREAQPPGRFLKLVGVGHDGRCWYDIGMYDVGSDRVPLTYYWTVH